jgi:23S rRNA pseudouridine1911/1915/1917 synthase
MNPSPSVQTTTINSEQAGLTVAALLRKLLPGHSWSAVERVVETRRVKVGGDLCLDPARRLKEGEAFELFPKPLPKPRHEDTLRFRHLDEHIVVVEKPSGINSVRHPAERDWDSKRKALSPTLEDLVARQIARIEGSPKGPRARLRVVHRLDKETSGLLVFARTVVAERSLGKQFRRHTVVRRYVAIVPGRLPAQTIRTFLVRDRGDGRRGSTAIPGQGKEAITHVEVAERLPGYTVLHCRLETGRTHQIRIHLAEKGHPVCGDRVYRGRYGLSPSADQSGAPRLALHAAELGFIHPVTREELLWVMDLPPDLEEFRRQLREGREGEQ